MLYWKRRIVWQKGEKKTLCAMHLLTTFCIHVFWPLQCWTRDLEGEGGMTTSLSGSAGASDSIGLVQPQGEFRKYSCGKQLCMEGEGFTHHVLLLQILCTGRYNKALIFPRKTLLRKPKQKV